MQKCTFCNHPSILSLPFCLPPNWPPPCSPLPPAKYNKRKRHKWNKPSSKAPQFLSFRVTHVNRLLAATRETVVTRQTSPQEVTNLHKDTMKDVSPENPPDLAVTIPPNMIRQPWNVAQDQSPKDNNEKTSPWSTLWTHGVVCLAKINVSLHCFHWHNAKARYETYNNNNSDTQSFLGAYPVTNNATLTKATLSHPQWVYVCVQLHPANNYKSQLLHEAYPQANCIDNTQSVHSRNQLKCRRDLRDRPLLASQHPQARHTTLQTANFITLFPVISFR